MAQSGYASFPKTTAGTTVVSGTCLTGYVGGATASCGDDGTWTFGSSSCTRMLPAFLRAFASFGAEAGG